MHKELNPLKLDRDTSQNRFILFPYMEGSYKEGQCQKVEVGIHEDPFDLISILLCETCDTNKGIVREWQGDKKTEDRTQESCIPNCCREKTASCMWIQNRSLPREMAS